MSSSPSDPHYLGFLDGLRGGAALWVLLAHCQIWGGYSFRIPNPKIAVDIFMVLSGYLMTHHYLAREGHDAARAWSAATSFWVRRFFRIAPLYYLLLVLVFCFGEYVRDGYTVLRLANPEYWAGDVVYDPRNVRFTVANFISHLTFTFGAIPKYARATLMPDWSIGLEMQFYAAFPFLFGCFRRWGHLTTVVVAAGACFLVQRYLVTWHGAPSQAWIVFPEPSFLALKLTLFLTGMLAAEAHWRGNRTFSRRALAGLLALVLAAEHSTFVVLSLAIVLLLGAPELGAGSKDRVPNALRRLLANRATQLMAETSYAVYLTHGFFIALVGGHLFQQPWFLDLAPPVRVGSLMVVVVIGAYGLALVLHRFVERPGIEMGRTLVRRMDRSNALVLASSPNRGPDSQTAA